MLSNPVIDTPITRTTVATMTDEQLNVMVIDLRDRRMRAYRAYEEGIKMQQEARSQKLMIQLKKQNEMLMKDLSTVDKAMVRVEKRILTLQSLRNELNIDIQLNPQLPLGDTNDTPERDTPTPEGQS